MNYEYEKIGERIKTERKKLRMTQEAFAEKYHVKRSTVSKWEHGEAMPNFQTMLDICADFNCELGYLLCENGYENKTRETTDICKATGLSEEAVEILQNEIVELNKRNKYLKPIERTLLADFTSYFTVNGENLFATLSDLKRHEVDLSEVMELPFYNCIEEAFHEVQRKQDYILFDEDENRWVIHNREDHFYYLLERLLEKLYSSKTTSKELVKIIKNAGVFFFDEEIKERMIEVIENADVVEETLNRLRFGLNVYELLEMELKYKYFKYEISDNFMDIVMAYVKEGVEDGRKDELQEER